MKLFARTGGHWLFWCGIFYVTIILGVAFSPYRDYTMMLQGVWIFAISIPLWCNPLASWLNMKETDMFDVFKKKNKLPDNVVPFPKEPAHGGGSGGGYIPPEPKKPAVTYYTLGMNSENRLEFKMGYSAITMNYGGVTNLIEQLKVYQKQLAEYEGIEEEESET
jgi:hypothetical protein